MALLQGLPGVVIRHALGGVAMACVVLFFAVRAQILMHDSERVEHTCTVVSASRTKIFYDSEDEDYSASIQGRISWTWEGHPMQQSEVLEFQSITRNSKRDVENMAKALLARTYKSGETIPCYVHPEKPTEAAVRPVKAWSAWLMLSVCFWALLGVLYACLSIAQLMVFRRNVPAIRSSASPVCEDPLLSRFTWERDPKTDASVLGWFGCWEAGTLYLAVPFGLVFAYVGLWLLGATLAGEQGWFGLVGLIFAAAGFGLVFGLMRSDIVQSMSRNVITFDTSKGEVRWTRSVAEIWKGARVYAMEGFAFRLVEDQDSDGDSVWSVKIHGALTEKSGVWWGEDVVEVETHNGKDTETVHMVRGSEEELCALVELLRSALK